jgi:hypothetical protein
MSDIKKMKVKNDYKKVEDSIGSSTDYKGLQTLANNIRVRITKDADYKHFVRLADNAEHKSKVVRILERCPSPSNETLLEQIAFNNFVEGCAVLDRTPSARVIHHQLNKLGYAKTMAKQIENEVGNAVFFEMLDKGIIKHTSEYFIYKFAKHLVSKNTYSKVADLFNSNEPLLQVA